MQKLTLNINFSTLSIQKQIQIDDQCSRGGLLAAIEERLQEEGVDLSGLEPIEHLTVNGVDIDAEKSLEEQSIQDRAVIECETQELQDNDSNRPRF